MDLSGISDIRIGSRKIEAVYKGGSKLWPADVVLPFEWGLGAGTDATIDEMQVIPNNDGGEMVEPEHV